MAADRSREKNGKPRAIARLEVSRNRHVFGWKTAFPALEAVWDGDRVVRVDDDNSPPARSLEMTVEQIQIRQQQAASKFELAAQIRKWLDDAKSEWKGDDDWDDVEREILELVTEDVD